ncbi:MAG: efflux RND transporter periplasmic adaptor subunit [Methylocystis sp.]|uniref:efflux RND transporter periplasmic adaptor subunit n=1 Tax=Methylocystis sp. TaxID=1911079 RepID=UPI003DA4C88F
MSVWRRFVLWSVFVALGGAGVYAWSIWDRPAKVSAPAAPAAVPVSVAIAETRDVPLILRGLGSVVAYATVDVKSRVVGSIVSVNFREGQEVRAGDLLVQLDARPYEAALSQANATLARDEANLANARADLARYAKLVRGNFISRQQYANQQATVAADEATIEADRSAVDAAKLNVEYCSIVSPIDGVVGIRQIDVGNLIQPNAQTLVVVTKIKPIYVLFTLPEANIAQLRQSMRERRPQVLAYDSTDQKLLSKGVLELIDNQVDPSTGTVKLKAQFANADLSLWPGQFVNAHLVVDVVRNAVVVPSVAVQSGPQGSFVYVVRADDTVDMRPVTVIQTEHNQSALSGGLMRGERVVTAGHLNIAPGVKVTVSPPARATPPPSSAAASAEGGR